ncbi:MAG: helix-turn-helix domain-containing protein [Candidatus Paceibacterota bacterium]|jgi:predicted transcriptional regulator
MSGESKNEIRELKKGKWYWIDKVIIQKCVPHIGAMGFTVYSFLASLVDSHQRCFPSQKYIAEKLGCSRSTVNKNIKNLIKYGLIKKEAQSRYHCTYVLMEVRYSGEETQVFRKGNSGVCQRDINDNKITRNNYNIDSGGKGTTKFKAFRKFIPRTREELLAEDLAKALDDYQGLPLYISLAKKYPEAFLRKILGQVKEIPKEKIKKSRGALFNHLVQKNK